jgi:hypothetical protein
MEFISQVTGFGDILNGSQIVIAVDFETISVKNSIISFVL